MKLVTTGVQERDPLERPNMSQRSRSVKYTRIHYQDGSDPEETVFSESSTFNVSGVITLCEICVEIGDRCVAQGDDAVRRPSAPQ